MMADYSNIINEAAKRFNVDPNLIRGIIATESGGNANARSGVGAQGLMQIMPSNYKALGITDPTDPRQNIMGGAQMISGLLDKYGDVQTALRHYQGGDDISRWGPINAAYPTKVLSAAGIDSKSSMPGVPAAPPQQAQTSDPFSSLPVASMQGAPSHSAAVDAFSSLPVGQSTPTMTANQGQTTSPGALESAAIGFGRGIGSTTSAIEQLLGKGASAIGLNAVGNYLSGNAADVLNQINQGSAAAQAAHPLATNVGDIAGSMLATAPIGGAIGPGAGLAAKIGAGALGGGIGSVLGTPVSPTSDNFWREKAIQGGTGLAFGGIAAPIVGALGRIISPQTSADVTQLMNAGVTPTPGQILGGGAAALEDKLTSIPVLGDLIKGAQNRVIKQFNTAAYNQALAPIGQNFSGEVGQEGISQVGKQIGNVYDDILPKMQFKIDPQFQQEVTNLGSMANSLPKNQQNTFLNILKNQIFDKLGPQGNMDGQTVKGVQSELARISSGYMGDPSFDNRQLGSAISALRDSVDGGLIRNNPQELTDQLSNANQAWANYSRLRAAASSMGAANNGGVFTPAQLQNAVRAGDKSVGKGAFATGNALMQDLSGAGQAVLGSKYPDSGTAGRGLLALLASGGTAGLITEPVTTLSTLGGAGLAALPYTQLGQRLAASALTSRPDILRQLGPIIGRTGTALIPGGAAALLQGSSPVP